MKRSTLSHALLTGSLVLLSLTSLPPCEQTASAREPIEFRFRGAKLGEPLSEATLTKRGYRCADGAPAGDRLCAKLHDTIGATPVNIFYHFNHGRFGALIIEFPHAHYSAIVAAFEGKLGAPHNTRQESVQNQMGASFTQDVASWQTTTGTLEISSYSTTLTDGQVIIIDPSFGEELDRRRQQSGTAAAKDL